MSDSYALTFDWMVKTGTTVPRREFDLIEFYKKVRETHLIIGVEFDVGGHMVIFHVVPKPKQEVMVGG